MTDMTAGGERPDFEAMADHGDARAQTYIAAAEKAWRDGNTLHMRRMLREAGINLEWAAVQREQDIRNPPGQVVDAEPDVKVHHTAGCELCGRRDEHTHTQADWRALIDSKAYVLNDREDQRGGYLVEEPDPYDLHGPLVDIDNVYGEDETLRAQRDDAAEFGDLATALRLDDALEDVGMHADDRRTCYSCQSWADHAHDQVTNRRVTLEQWEGRAAAPEGWDYAPGGSDDDTGRGPFEMPPAAEPWQPPAKPEVCGICDQPEDAHPKTQYAPEGADPQDGHHYCPVGRRCPTCQAPYGDPTTTGAEIDMTTHGQEARNRWNHSRTGRTVNNVWDAFMAWLFKGWGDPGTTYWKPERPPTSKEIRERVDAKFAERQAIDSIPAAPEVAEQDDTRPQPQPQNLDAVVEGVAPPPPVAENQQPPPPPLVEYVDAVPNWCNCTGLAHEAECRANSVGTLDISDLLPPPAGEDEPAEPVSNQP